MYPESKIRSDNVNIFTQLQRLHLQHNNVTRFIGVVLESELPELMHEYCPKGSLQVSIPSGKFVDKQTGSTNRFISCVLNILAIYVNVFPIESQSNMNRINFRIFCIMMA